MNFHSSHILTPHTRLVFGLSMPQLCRAVCYQFYYNLSSASPLQFSPKPLPTAWTFSSKPCINLSLRSYKESLCDRIVKPSGSSTSFSLQHQFSPTIYPHISPMFSLLTHGSNGYVSLHQTKYSEIPMTQMAPLAASLRSSEQNCSKPPQH